MKAMIFAAGLGTRLKPLTDTLPKALVPLAGKTLLQWQIERLKAAGITDIVVNVHHFPDMIINYLRENDNFGCRIAVSDERDMLLETGGGLRKAKSLLTSSPNSLIASSPNPLPLQGESEGAPILICNVDILSNIDIPTLLRAYNPDEMGVVVVSSRETQRYLLFDETNRLCGWTNIATGEVRPASLVSSLNILPPTGEADLQAKPTYQLQRSDLSLRGWTNIATGEVRPASLVSSLNILPPTGEADLQAKPTYQLQRSDLSPLAFSGMQVLNPRIFDAMDKVVAEKGDKFSLIDLYLSIAEKEILRAFIPENYRMMDVGKIAQLSEAESFAASL